MQRLQAGAAFLRIVPPFSATQLQSFARELIARNQIRNALLRLTLSRGVGVRGYSPGGAKQPTVVMSLHAAEASTTPMRWRLVTASVRLPAGEPIAQFKTCNKLSQIVARMEADAAGANEALLLNTEGHAVEGASSNLFWVRENTICTPPLVAGILAGVTRAVVFELSQKLGLQVAEASITPSRLAAMDGVFMSLSSLGIVAADSLDGTPLKQSPVVLQLAEAYWKLVEKETDGNADFADQR